MRRLRIAMIGQKAIPARYGGVETHVEQISLRLAAAGHEVWVYCRSRYRPSEGEVGRPGGFRKTDAGLAFHGVGLTFRPSIPTKHLDAATHSLICALDAGVRGAFDIVHFHGIGPSAFAPIPRLAGRTVVSTLHALDWRQVKWGRLAKFALKTGEATGARRSHGVITVSRILTDYVRSVHGVDARYIPNGAAIRPPKPPRLIGRYGLGGNDYVLTVGRIIPDRGLHTLIDAFVGIAQPVKLVIVGSESPRTAYSEDLQRRSDGRVVFTGDLYGEVLEELYSNCRFYVLASLVEGLSISVCEAMGYGKGLLLSDIPENREAGGDIAFYFKTGDIKELQKKFKTLLESPAAVEARSDAARRRAETDYNWDRVAANVADYYAEILERRGRLPV